MDSCCSWVLFQADLPEVRKRYNLLLKEIIGLIKRELGANLVSVYLLGSPGRGHATLFKKGDTWEIANDFDLAIVLRRRIERMQLLKLMMSCTNIVNPSSKYVRGTFSEVDFHVDIMQFVQSELEALSPTLFNADFAYGGLLLEGLEVRSVIRFDLFQIPLFEAYLLLYNRLCSMIESVRAGQYSATKGDKSPDWNTTLYFAKKGLIDSGSAILIAMGQYSPNYMERIERLRAISQEFANRYEYWIGKGGLIDPSALTGVDLLFVWREGYEALKFARNQIRLPDLNGSNGRLSWRVVQQWWVAMIRAEYSFRQLAFGNQFVKVLKGTGRIIFSIPKFWRRLRIYAEAESLAQKWYIILNKGFWSDFDMSRWYAQTQTIIDRWKRLHWE